MVKYDYFILIGAIIDRTSITYQVLVLQLVIYHELHLPKVWCIPKWFPQKFGLKRFCFDVRHVVIFVCEEMLRSFRHRILSPQTSHVDVSSNSDPFYYFRLWRYIRGIYVNFQLFCYDSIERTICRSCRWSLTRPTEPEVAGRLIPQGKGYGFRL